MNLHLRTILEALREDVKTFCYKVDQRVLKKHPNKTRDKIKIREWPAAVCSCCFDTNIICHDESGSPANIEFDRRIENEFTRLGGFKGSKVPFCKNRLGYCAEQHAANLLLNKTRGYTYKANIKSIKLSKAYRPRTMKRIRMCNNCKRIFN